MKEPTSTFLAIVARSRAWRRQTRLFILWAVAAASFLVLYFLPQMPLQPGYHDFVDRRVFLRIPNTLNVASNLPFILVGAQGILFLLRSNHKGAFRESRERVPYFLFFAGVTLTGLGSCYYHLAPDDPRLVWDLLPMTLSFVSLLSAVVMERIAIRAGLGLLVPLVALGAASVSYWHRGALLGHGDIRFYLYVQFFSPVLIGVLLLLFPPEYSGARDLGIAFALYVLAKAFEFLDKSIFAAGSILSGHTLKHLTAALACYWILRMLQKRTILRSDSAPPQPSRLPVQSSDGAPDPRLV